MNECIQPPELTPERLVELDVATPRYTSFPTADRFASIQADTYAEILAESVKPSDEEWTLYAHLPFCKSLCLYCGCNVKITRSDPMMNRYMAALLTEITQVAQLSDGTPRVSSIHLGGGTPNYFRVDVLGRLIEAFRRNFDVQPDAEIAIEADPRMATVASLPALAQVGFNRISFGIQDFDPIVQRAIRRVHTYEHAKQLRAAAAAAGFRSVNFDLIYGLPHQTVPSFRQTLRMVIQANPDRIALYGFAFVPWLKKHQEVLRPGLPDAETRWRLFELAYELLTEAGYVAIGMDHFARPEDPLAKAYNSRQLRRNFQGYTASEQPNSLAFGASAIGNVAGTFIQNERDVTAYMNAIESRGLATIRGLGQTEEDRRNGWVISQLMCFGDVAAEEYRAEFDRDFAEDHAIALAKLAEPPLNVLVERANPDGVEANVVGLRLIRRIAAAFDPYLRNRDREKEGPRFSSTV